MVGYADCKYYAGLVETPKSLTLCQTHCKQVPVFSRLSNSHLITWSKLTNHSHRHNFGTKTRPKAVKEDHHIGKLSCVYALTHVAFLQFLHTGQYGLCYCYCFSGPLPLRSHKEQVTFPWPFLGVPSHLDYTQNWPEPS